MRLLNLLLQYLLIRAAGVANSIASMLLDLSVTLEQKDAQ